MENHRLAEPNSLNAMLAVSPSFSSHSSSDLDTESTGSFFYDKSITLGSLMGLKSDIGVSTRVIIDGQELPSIGLEVPQRSKQSTRSKRSKSWWRLCRNCEDSDCHENISPSLGHFLEVERRTTVPDREERMYINIMYDEFTAGQTVSDRNLLFAEGRILPPQSAQSRDQLPTIGTNRADSNCSWVPGDCFSTNAVSSRSPISRSHHGSQSGTSRLPTLFSGICGGKA